MKEFTWRAVILGAIFGALFGAVSVYVGLRAGRARLAAGAALAVERRDLVASKDPEDRAADGESRSAADQDPAQGGGGARGRGRRVGRGRRRGRERGRGYRRGRRRGRWRGPCLRDGDIVVLALRERQVNVGGRSVCKGDVDVVHPRVDVDRGADLRGGVDAVQGHRRQGAARGLLHRDHSDARPHLVELLLRRGGHVVEPLGLRARGGGLQLAAREHDLADPGVAKAQVVEHLRRLLLGERAGLVELPGRLREGPRLLVGQRLGKGLLRPREVARVLRRRGPRGGEHAERRERDCRTPCPAHHRPRWYGKNAPRAQAARG